MVLMTGVWLTRPDRPEPVRLGVFMGEPGPVELLSDERTLLYLERGLSYVPNGAAGHLVPDLKLLPNRIWCLSLGNDSIQQWPMPDGVDPASCAASAGAFRLAVIHKSGLWVVDRNGQGRQVLSESVSGPLDWDENRISCRVGGLPSWVALDGTVALREEASEGETTRRAVDNPGRVIRTDPALDRAFARVQGALNTWTHGRQAVYSARYRDARREFRGAGKGLRKLLKERTKWGLAPGSLQGYVDAIALWDTDDEALMAAVCKEHMLVLGELCLRYSEQHDGAMPDDHQALMAWVETLAPSGSGDHLPAMGQLLCCPAAAGDHVPKCGYELLPEGGPGDPLLKCHWHVGAVHGLVVDRKGCRVDTRPLVEGEVDSLFNVGVTRFDSGDTRGAVLPIRAAVHQHPKDGAAHQKLGYVYLKAGQHEAAKWAFKRAGALDMGNAEPFYGLGLVHIEQPNKRYEAIKYFQKALKRDYKHADARYRIALARYAMNEHDTVDELERVLEIDPDYADAYMLMGDWYATYWEDFERAIVWYSEYLARRPNDKKGTQRLGLAYVKAKNYEKILESLVSFLRKHPDAVGLMPVIAQAFAEQKRYDQAEEFFSSYVDWLEESERAIYEDIRHVASEEETAEYESTSGAQREAYLKRFWANRDPDVTTPANERRVEHYRRVWFARQEFSKTVQPWDRRGEVYVRFGEPDHRSTSANANFSRALAVQRVKERLAVNLYGSDAVMHTFSGPVFPVETFSLRKDVLGMETTDPEMFLEAERDATGGDESDLELRQLTMDSGERDGSVATENDDDQLLAATFGEGGDISMPSASEAVAGLIESSISTNPFGFDGWAPGLASDEDKTSVRWETWTYLGVDGGIEISFTDEFGDGTFGFAQVPSAPGIPIGLMVNLRRYSPEKLYERATSLSPDFYAPNFQAEHFDFHYTFAGFRGQEKGKSAIEVYYGLPCPPNQYNPAEDITNVAITRAMAMLPEAADTVYRQSSDFVLRAQGNLTGRNASLPDVARLEVPPGTYRMEVKARNRLSGRLGIYRQQMVVSDYGESGLDLSDIELAWQISESDEAGPFVKNGVKVIPMPSRTYSKGQNPFVYYEIYNLERDVFGNSRYQVTYTVAPKGGNVLSSLARTLTGKGRSREVAVGYEQVGSGESEVVFTEISLENTMPGRYSLAVEVRDLVNGKKTIRETTFIVAE
jgi:GWxTD domain-containing protein